LDLNKHEAGKIFQVIQTPGFGGWRSRGLKRKAPSKGADQSLKKRKFDSSEISLERKEAYK